MNRNQIILLSSGIILLCIIFFFGKTTAPASAAPPENAAQTASAETVTTEKLIDSYKKSLNNDQLQKLTQLENAVVRGDVKDQSIKIFRQLSAYWGDSLGHDDIGAVYLGKAAALENSEKNLSFAARLFLDNLLVSDNPAIQNWLGSNGKELFEKVLKINPDNDSAAIGLGACYLFGNLSDNPMQGLMMIKGIADKDSLNMYAQMMLGLGGIKSGQYDKAITRFTNVIQHEPHNLEAVFHLAETYERMNDKANAIVWYKRASAMIEIPEAKQEIENRIKSLQ